MVLDENTANIDVLTINGNLIFKDENNAPGTLTLKAR